jgi:hypothetical protein
MSERVFCKNCGVEGVVHMFWGDCGKVNTFTDSVSKLSKPYRRYGFEFRFQYEDGTPEISVKVHQDADLDKMAETFETFLKAVGYSPDLKVEITTEGKK